MKLDGSPLCRSAGGVAAGGWSPARFGAGARSGLRRRRPARRARARSQGGTSLELRSTTFRRNARRRRETSERATDEGDHGLHIAFVLALILFAVVVGAGTAISPCV